MNLNHVRMMQAGAIALAGILAAAVIVAAGELPADQNGVLTCVGCEPSRGISFGYDTYLGEKALVTIEQLKQQKENEAWNRATAAGLGERNKKQ